MYKDVARRCIASAMMTMIVFAVLSFPRKRESKNDDKRDPRSGRGWQVTEDDNKKSPRKIEG